uniref:Putative secreted protein n=1 Tax=Anopheles darlingi TaxID=43151 RepID=A0A2M4DND2_ANODA
MSVAAAAAAAAANDALLVLSINTRVALTIALPDRIALHRIAPRNSSRKHANRESQSNLWPPLMCCTLHTAYGVCGAWVLRCCGPPLTNTRSTPLAAGCFDLAG